MIDSHHHLWKYSADEYAWIPPDSALAHDYLLTELEVATTAAGVDATVVVQARQVIEESHELLALSDRSTVIAGVIGWVPLTHKTVAEPLAQLAAHLKFKGVRHVLQDEPDDYFLRDDFHQGLAILPDLDLRYDLLIFARQLPVAIQLVDRQPELGIILNHIAKPQIRKGLIDPTWRAGMVELARRDNILGVKISGMVTEVMDKQIDDASLLSYFEETLTIFGPERLMFGSDWPVNLLREESYSSWVSRFHEFLRALSPSEQLAIEQNNAERVYNLSTN